MSAWKTIDSAPKDREIILAGQYAVSGNWDIRTGQWLATRWPFVGERQPSHWQDLPAPPLHGESNARFIAGPKETK